MSNVLHMIASVLAKLWAVPAVTILSLAGYNTAQLTHSTPPAPVAIVQSIPDHNLDIQHLQSRLEALEGQNLGATNALPTSVAIFATSLQGPITSSQTSLTLVSATYNNGLSSLASSSYDFVIDEGTSVQEFVSADCNGATCTNMQRGLSWLNGTTTVPSLQFSHRRGASVKITDAPILLKLNWLANGGMSFPNPIVYSSSIATSTIAQSRNNIASWGLVQDTAFTGSAAIKATTGAAGYVQLATPLQQASSTSTLNGQPLVIQSGNATSSCAATTTSVLNVLVTDNSGRLNGNCVPATFTATTTFATQANFSTSTATSTNIGSFPAYWIGKNVQVFTSSGTFTVPPGISKVTVWLFGAGGGGGGGANNAITAAGGGGSGGFGIKEQDVTGTTSIAITIGAAGPGGTATLQGTTGGTSFFSSFFSCTGGVGGSVGSSGAGISVGNGGGVCTGADASIGGNTGQSAFAVSGTLFPGIGAYGAMGNLGAGGTGANSQNGTGAAGAAGYALITW